MSIRHISWALDLDDARLRPTDKLTLVAIAHSLDARDPERGTWIGLETIAARVGIALRNARTTVRRLTGLGLLRTEFREGRSSIYRLPEVAAQADDSTRPRMPASGVALEPRMSASGVAPEPRMSASGVPRMSASGVVAEPRMPASGGGGCTHPGGRMHASPDPSSIQEMIHHPPHPPHGDAPTSEPPCEAPVVGGGDDFFSGESFEQSGARLRRWWSEEIAPLDDRILPLEVVSNEQVRLYRDARRLVPDLEDRIRRGLDPVAKWVAVRITPELLFKSQSALNRAVGGFFQEKDPERLRAYALARQASDRARRLAATKRRLDAERAKRTESTETTELSTDLSAS